MVDGEFTEFMYAFDFSGSMNSGNIKLYMIKVKIVGKFSLEKFPFMILQI